jgi:hypothetical protein
VLSFVWHPQEDAVIGLEKAGLLLQLNAECKGISIWMLFSILEISSDEVWRGGRLSTCVEA